MQISHDPRLHDPDPGPQENPRRKVAFLLEKSAVAVKCFKFYANDCLSGKNK